MKDTMDNTTANGFEDDTTMEYIKNEDEMEEKFTPNLDATDENCCTYTKFLETSAKKRRLTLDEPQALYLCLTCCPQIRKILKDCAQVCSACSYHCHENHELVEWYTKHNLSCDCPTKEIPKAKCKLNPKGIASRSKAQKTSKILNSTRKRPYPDSDAEPEPDIFSDTLQDLSVIKQNHPYTSNFPHHLIGLMYRFDLSILCSLRKIKYEEKYPSLSFEFKNQGLFDKFDIILRDEDKSIYVQIDPVDKYKFNDIGYSDLFSKDRRHTCVNQYLDNFIRYLFASSDTPPNNVQYFVVYTNASLDLTEDNQLRPRRFKLFYPFTFVSVIEECDLLREFLFTNGSAKGRDFYQFSLNESAREELLQRLYISPAMEVEIKYRNLSQDELKNQFLEKLVLAVNQPNREELNMIIKSEVAESGNTKCGYSALQKKVLRFVETSHKAFYEINLLTAFMHDMFTRRKIVSINSERQKSDIYNDITVHYKNKIAYIKVIYPLKKVGYGQLFSIRKPNSLNSLFSLYLQQPHENLTYFIVYSYTPIDLNKEMILRRQSSKAFYPLKLTNVDIHEKEYKILRNRSYINEAGLYKFSNKKSTRRYLLELLNLPANLENENLSEKSDNELKKAFIDKLIFAVSQPNNKELKNIVKKEIKASEVPYSSEELREIALRWSESHELGSFSMAVMEKLLEDLQNNRLSYRNNQIHLSEESQFAKKLAKTNGSGYEQLLQSLVKERRLKLLKSKGINLMCLCTILRLTGSAALKAFNDLYDLLLDVDGNKTKYLMILEKNGVSFTTVSSILTGSKGNAAQGFKSLFDSWFDEEGNKTQYLVTLENEGLNLIDVANTLRGAGANASKDFKELYRLWFDDQGNKSEYLKNLEIEGISLTDMTSLLCGARVNPVVVFKEFYGIWFDIDGNKTRLFKALEEEGLNLRTVLGIVSGIRTNAAIAFKHLYRLWFDTDGKKAQCLRVFEENGIHLPCISNVLKGAGAYAAKVLKDLYDFCFDKDGIKTEYLTNLEAVEIDLSRMFTILIGAGNSAARTLKKLYHLWFDEDGNKSHYVLSLEERGISLRQICSTLKAVGSIAATSFKDSYDSFIDEKQPKGECLKVLNENGVNLVNIRNIFGGAVYKDKAFLDLYDLWFDEQGNKTDYVQKLEEQGIDLHTISAILSGAGTSAHRVFKDFCETLFDRKGNKTDFLEALEENGIDLANVCNHLQGSGVDLSKAISEFYYTFLDETGNRNPFLDHFLEKKGEGKSFKMQNVLDILRKSGTKIRDSFEQLHDVCFNDKGERTQLLDDFYKAGFKPSNLANLLNGTGISAVENLKKFHSFCFNEKGNTTNILGDFTQAGFTCGDLCSLLSGTPNSIEILHDFCFARQTKAYLKHLLSDTDGFPPAYLSKIVHGSGADICSVLRDFHQVCFDEGGIRTHVLDDFYNAGFTPRQLANMLSMTGRKASFILKNLHKLCFGQESYLGHFFTEQDLFSPKKLSKILCGTGVNVCFSFEKLHNLCFDAEGNNTKYFTKLMKHNTTSEILENLHHECVAVSNTFSGDKSFIKKELLENW